MYEYAEIQYTHANKEMGNGGANTAAQCCGIHNNHVTIIILIITNGYCSVIIGSLLNSNKNKALLVLH